MRITMLEELAKKGNTFTIEHVLSTTNIQKEVLWVILSRLEKKGWIERIEKGKYISKRGHRDKKNLYCKLQIL